MFGPSTIRRFDTIAEHVYVPLLPTHTASEYAITIMKRFTGVSLSYWCSSYRTIKTSVDAAVKSYTITLANAPKRNTLSYETLNELSRALQDVDARTLSKEVKVGDYHMQSLFIRSEGAVYSSGHDLKELSNPEHVSKIFGLCTQTLLSLSKLPIPVVAVVNGLAAAAGCQLVASCDLVIATTKSSFSTPGVKWGIFCTTPGVALVRAMSSQKKALEMLLLGEPITASEAYNFGLVSKLVEEADLEKQVTRHAESINKLSGEVIALGKRAYWQQRSKSTAEEAYKPAVAAMCENLTKADSKEGLKAFSEKRHPKYTN